MAISKHSSSKSTHKSSTAKPAAKPAETRKPTELKPQENNKVEDAKKPTKTDKPDKAEKTANGKVEENGDVKEAGKLDENGKPIEDGKQTEEGKEPKDEFKDSEELKKAHEEKEPLREESQGLKDALASLYDMMGSEDDKKEAPESPGGCCGRPKSTNKTGEDDQNKDWNSILTAGIAAVKAQNLGGGNMTLLNGGQSGQGQNGQQKPGGMATLAAGKGASKGANGQSSDPRTKLASDYQKAKAANAELRPEVENEVRSLLGMPPLEGKGQGQTGGASQGLPMAAGF